MSAAPSSRKAPASESSSSPPPSSPSSARSRRDLRPLLLVLATAIFAAASAGALLARPWSDPLRAPGLLPRLVHPIELNADLRLLATNAALTHVFALDADHVWAAGAPGVVLYSRDGGDTWQRGAIHDQPVPAARPPSRKRAALDRLWPITDAHAADLPQVSRSRIGKSATAAPDQAPNPTPNAAKEPAAQIGPPEPAATANAVPPVDQSPTPTTPAPALPAGVRSLRFVDADTGWLVADGVFRSDDGGANWYRQNLATPRSLVFVDRDYGWLLTADGRLSRTEDGGRIWRDLEPRSLTGELFFIDRTNGWLASSGSGLLATRDGGQTWSQVPLEAPPAWMPFFADPQRGWVIDSRGALWSTQDGGAHWQSAARLDLAPLDLSFADAQHGWVMGRRQAAPYEQAAAATTLLQATDDGGASWRALAPDAAQPARAIALTGDGRGWIVGDGGLILATRDGGASWLAQTRGLRTAADGRVEPYDLRSGESLPAAPADARRYHRLPAPLCWLGWLLSALLALVAARLRAPDTAASGPSIEDLLSPDRPLRPDDPDPLGAGGIARGLSRFLRNPRTEPSLTIAVVGAWGTGKSSVMNLLQADLQHYDLMPVWFNAWHHQKGEELLASLFANIRAQAVPGLLTRNGLEFYLRLAMRRFRRRWLAFVLLSLPLALSWGFLARNYSALFDGSAGAGWLDTLLSPRVAEAAQWLSIGGATLPALALLRVLRAFGVNVGSLMTRADASLKSGRVEARPSARYQFAQEFAEVTDALGDRPMVIFVDDLDRCDKAHVVDVLETINFLICSGRCFIVMGLDKAWIETCIGLRYQDLAEDGRSDADLGQRTAFAKRYLEKIINIEVPVPRVPDMAQRLLTLAGHPPARAPERGLHWDRLPLWSRGVMALALALVALGLAVRVGWNQSYEAPPRTPPPDYLSCVSAALRSRLDAGAAADGAATVDWNCVGRFLLKSQGVDAAPPVPAAVSSAASLAANGGGAMAASNAPAPAEPSSGPLLLIDPASASGSPWLRDGLQVAALAITGLLVFLWWRRPDPRAKDSPEFQDALQIWTGVIALGHPTPRSIKRFLNRVRFLAMRARDPAPDGSAPLRESSLVGLYALYALDPALLDRPLSAASSFAGAPAPGEAGAKSLATRALVDGVENHVRRWGEASLAGGAEIDAFRQLLGDVRMN